VTVTVSSTAGTPTGNATLTVDNGTPLSAALNSSGVATFTLTSPSAGDHSLSASYAAQGNFAASGPTTATLHVNQATPTVTVGSGSFTYDSNPHPAVAKATGVGGASVTGSFSYSYAPGGVNPPVGAGTYSVTANFTSGDPNYGNTSGPGTITINQAWTTTAVMSSLPTSNWGNAVIWTATVSPQVSGTPTGTVDFYNASSATTTCSTVTGAPFDGDEVLSAGQASTTNAWLPTGTDYILACYKGDTNFLTSTGTGSSSTPFTQTVNMAPLATLTPNSLSFGNQQGGTTSSAQTVMLSNSFNGYNGTAPLSLSISFTGNNFNWFTESDNCSTSLQPGASCQINMKFSPPLNGTGVASAFLTVTDNNENITGSMQTTSLVGAGLTSITDQSLYTNAIFATASTCGSITLSGGSTVDSFSSAQGYGQSHQNTGGNVATNGNVTLNGSKTVVYGTDYTPSTVKGNCSSSSMTGLTLSGASQPTGGLAQLPNAPVTYPAPPAPSPAPPTTSQNISGSCPSGMSGCTNNGSKSVALAPGSYGNVTISGGTTAHFSKGTYNINSLTLSGKSIFTVDSGPVVVNLAGASLSGAAQVLDLT